MQDNVRKTQEAYAAFGQGDIPTVLEFMTDDIEWVVPGPAELPPSSTQRGKQELGAWFGKLNAALEFQRFEPYKFLADDDTVVALLHVAARWRHNGAPTEADEVHVFTYRDGKVGRFRCRSLCQPYPLYIRASDADHSARRRCMRRAHCSTSSVHLARIRCPR